MRVRLSWAALPFVVALVGTPVMATATTIDLSWNSCSSTLTQIDPGGVGDLVLYVTAIGQTEVQQGYEFWLTLGDIDDQVPDAWRFDPEGCQGSSRITIDHLQPAACVKCCFSFQGTAPSLQIKSFQFAPSHLGVPTSRASIVLANVYPSGMTNIVPTRRWHLAAIHFYHSGSSVEGPGTPGVSCGGFERGLCFAIHAPRANWFRMNGEAVPFEIGRGFATFRGDCVPTPAVGSTWGAIKSQYRH